MASTTAGRVSVNSAWTYMWTFFRTGWTNLRSSIATETNSISSLSRYL